MLRGTSGEDRVHLIEGEWGGAGEGEAHGILGVEDVLHVGVEDIGNGARNLQVRLELMGLPVLVADIVDAGLGDEKWKEHSHENYDHSAANGAGIQATGPG